MYVTERCVASLSILKRPLARVSRSTAWAAPAIASAPARISAARLRLSRPSARVPQGDRRRAVVARDGDRQRAVLGDPEAHGKPVQLKPTDLHLRQKCGEGIEGDLARRGRKDGAPGGVADGQAPEPEAHAPRIVHDIGRAEIDGEAVSRALLQARGDLVVQHLEIDRPLGEADGERQRADEGEERQRLDDPREHMQESPRPAAPRGRRKARSFGALDHAAHLGPGARARSELESTDQLRNVLRGLRAAKTLPRRFAGGDHSTTPCEPVSRVFAA